MGQPKAEGQTKKSKCPLTDFIHHGGINSLGGIIPAFEFEVTMRSPNLWIPPYSSHQERLFTQILALREDGLTFLEVASALNESGLMSTRGTTFTAALVHSLLKKGRARVKRLETPVSWTIRADGLTFLRLI